MNPSATATQPIARRPIVNDISRPAAVSRRHLQSVPVAAAPQIVDNIPLRAPIDRPLGDDEELERIMRDVGQELKASEKKQAKKKFLFFSRKQKTRPDKTISARRIPAASGQPALSIPASLPPASASQITPAVSNQAGLKLAKKQRSSIPVFVFLLTIVAASALIAMAWSAYAQ